MRKGEPILPPEDRRRRAEEKLAAFRFTLDGTDQSFLSEMKIAPFDTVQTPEGLQSELQHLADEYAYQHWPEGLDKDCIALSMEDVPEELQSGCLDTAYTGEVCESCKTYKHLFEEFMSQHPESSVIG